MNTRSRIGTIAATVALGLAPVGALASAASAAPSTPAVHSAASAKGCSTWHDRNTYGVKCTHHYGGYEAVARCKDGSKQYGISTMNGHWSYAWCAGHRGLKYGWVAQ